MTPFRICDTRLSNPSGLSGLNSQCRAKTLGPGGSLTVQVAGANPTGTAADGIPAAGVTAVVLNMTVVNTTAASYLTAWPAGTARPSVSAMDWVAGQSLAHLLVVAPGTTGAVALYNAFGATDIVVDAEGYMDSTPGGLYTPLNTARICDTRPARAGADANPCNGNGTSSETLGPNAAITVSVGGQGGVPATGITAVVVNLTVTDTTSSSYLTAWPDGASRPATADLVWAPQQTVPNRVIVGVGSDGKIMLYNLGGRADVIVDVSGYYSAPVGSLYAPVAPTRICDTRPAGTGISPNQCDHNGTGPGTLDAGGVLSMSVASHGGVPTTATAVALNVTVTGTTAPGYLTAYPSGFARPIASDLNWSAGATTSNLVVVELNAGAINFYLLAGRADLVVDLAGYFNGVPPAVAWTAADPIDTGGGIPAAVSCTGPSFCAAVDSAGYAFTYNGIGWTRPTDISPDHGLVAVSCPTAQTCLAVTNSGNLFRYNGAQWILQGNPGVPAGNLNVPDVSAFSCPTTTFCAGIDNADNALLYTIGATNSTVVTHNGPFLAVSCSSSTSCTFLNGNGDAVTYNGTTWSGPASVISGGVGLLSCPTSTFCVAASWGGRAVTYQGGHWGPAADIDPRGLYALSCSSSTFCVAVDGSGQEVTYNGAIWSPPIQIDIFINLVSVSCTGPEFCAVIDGRGGNALTFKAGAWGPPIHVDNGNLTALACATISACDAADGTGRVFSYGGTAWIPPTTIDPDVPLVSMSCPAPTFCVALDEAGQARRYDGVTWSVPTTVFGGSPSPVALSCPTTTFCVAVSEYTGQAAIYQNSTWATPTTMDAKGLPLAISCPTTTFCVAVDYFGRAVVYHQGIWSISTPLVTLASLRSVSCASATWCVAVSDYLGQVVILNGAQWSAPISVDPANYLTSVSCPSATFCAAVDGAGNALTFDGRVWSAPNPIDPPNPLTVVSCPTTTFCAAVGSDGNALVAARRTIGVSGR